MTGKNIAAGMDKIFADLMGGKTFAAARSNIWLLEYVTISFAISVSRIRDSESVIFSIILSLAWAQL